MGSDPGLNPMISYLLFKELILIVYKKPLDLQELKIEYFPENGLNSPHLLLQGNLNCNHSTQHTLHKYTHLQTCKKLNEYTNLCTELKKKLIEITFLQVAQKKTHLTNCKSSIKIRTYKQN